MQGSSNVRIRRTGWAERFFKSCGVLAITLTVASAAEGDGFDHWLAKRLGSRLPVVERRLAEIDSQVKGLPLLPDLDSLGTHGFHSNFTSGSEENWFSIAWAAPRTIDGIALLPTRLTTQSGDTSNYGFPRALRVEAMVPGARDPIVLAELPDSHLGVRRGDPVFFEIPPTEVLSLRFIPVDLPRLPGKHVRFFSVSELMVFQGERNIAPDGVLSAAFSIDAEFGWNLRYLVDGQSPLGPPELKPQNRSLGWHTDLAETGSTPTWAAIDLGGELRFDSVNIVAARGDSPVKGPGFGFPVRFQIEVRRGADRSEWETVWSSGGRDFPNPGYNPVTLHFPPVSARYVRLVISRQHQPDPLTAPRVLLSEFQVLDGLANLALGKPVTTPDRLKSRPHDGARVWSVEGLTDGYSSTGRLIPLRRWVSDLSRHFDLELERRALSAERATLLEHARIWGLSAIFSLLSVVIIGLVFWQIRLRLLGRRQVKALRHRISSDLHDEVGSNLATIALLAEVAPPQDPSERFSDISRMARESSLSLREIVDLTITPNRARKPLPERLREIANLMLKQQDWKFIGDATPGLDPEQRRNLVFFIKEALHNISRHAAARHVTIHFDADDSQVTLRIADDGCGLPPPPPGGRPRLRALEQRAESLHGSLAVESEPGHGTTLTLRFLLRKPR
jgi:signal transduction histidine kinase